MLGLLPGRSPSFSRDFAASSGSVAEALAAYVAEVKAGTFPGPDETLF
jgi:3-methyl-2-oxobutanoate hydroxymethyltransferase